MKSIAVIECDDEGRVAPYGKQWDFEGMDNFKNGMKALGLQGWKFCGLHEAHMGKNFDLVYINKTGKKIEVENTSVWQVSPCGKMTFYGRV